MTRIPHGFVNTAPAIWAMTGALGVVAFAAAVLRAVGGFAS